MTIKRKIDLAILILWPIIGSMLAFLLNINTTNSVVIFFVIPSIYLSFRERRHILKAIVFSIFGTPLIILIDYIAEITNAWLIPDSVLSYRLFDFVTLEVIIWMFFHLYFVIIFYEYFIDKHKTDKLWLPKIKYFVSIVAGLSLLFLILLFSYPQALYIPYWYLLMGIVLILIPITLQGYNFPRVFLKFLKVAAYFFYLTFIYEITALKLGWWSFPGRQYVGWVYFFGVKFPFEEFFFWLMLTAIAILSCYEFFDDDER